MPEIKETPARDLERVVEQDFKYYTDMWASTFSNWDNVDNFYHRKYPLWPGVTPQKAAKRGVYRPSTPTNIIDHAADTQLAFQPKLHREPMGEGDAHKESADRIEIALSAILNDSALREVVIPFKQMGRYALQYGRMCIDGPNLDYSLKPVEPKRGRNEDEDEFDARMAMYRAAKKNWNPICYKAIHPARVLCDPFKKQPDMAIIKGRMPAFELARISAEKMKKLSNAQEYKPDEKSLYDMVSVTDHWTLSAHTFKVVGGPVLWTEKNTWGFVPVAQALSGFGMEPASQDDFDPSHLAVGLLDPIMDSLRVQAQGRSARHELLMEAAYAPEGTTQDPQETAQRKARGDILQGDQEDFWTMKTKQVPAWMFEEGREADQDIEQGSFPRMLGGYREPGVSTVGQQALLQSKSGQKFIGVAVQIEHLASITAGRILRIVDTIKDLRGSIGVRGKTLKASDIHHIYDVDVSFEVMDPVMDLQRRELGMREVQMGLKSWESYQIEDVRREDVAAEKRRIRRERIEANPEVAAKFAMKEAEMMGIEDEVAAALGQEQEAAGMDGRMTEMPMGMPDVATMANTPSAAERELREPLAGDVAKPKRIEVI